jgi:hypothetical protein
VAVDGCARNVASKALLAPVSGFGAEQTVYIDGEGAIDPLRTPPTLGRLPFFFCPGGLDLGRMFWLWWKTLSGSYVVFTSTSRS